MMHSGEVTAIYENNVTTKFGDKQAYKAMIGGKKCDFAFKKPSFSKGDTVTVIGDEGQYGIKVTSYEVTSGGSRPAAAASSPVVNKAQEVLPVPLNRERCIIRQNALTAAVNFLKDIDTVTAPGVIAIAREFEAYTSGDSDFELLRQASDEMLGE